MFTSAIIIVISFIQFGLRKFIFSIFDDLENPKKITKNKLNIILIYTLSVPVVGLILGLTGTFYLFSGVMAISQHQTANISLNQPDVMSFLVKGFIIIVTIITQIFYLLLPLANKMKKFSKYNEKI